MAIDPNIALGVRPIEIANPLTQYGQIAQLQAAQNQNQLAQLQMREAEANAQERNALRQLNPNAPDYEAQLFKVNPQLGIAYRKEASAAAAQEATRKKTAVETTGLEFKQRIDKANKAISDIAALNSPQEAMASIDQHLANGDIDQQKADMLKGQLAQAPSFGAWQKGMLVNILDAKDRLTQTSPKPVQVTRADGSIIFLDENPNSPTFQKEVMPAQATGMTPAQIAANRIAQQQANISGGNLAVNQAQLALAQENAVKPVFNAQVGGFVAPPTKANPQGAFTPLTGVQESKDQQAAVKALKSAGYNPVTGEDNISKLIAKSTSGGLEAGTSAALAFFGKSTEGRKAIAALEGTANQIATDLAGGKLGAGISNTDRDFIVGALGDVSNPMKTSAERLAGWTAAKNRMVSAGVIPAPATAAPNIDALLNKYK